MPKIVQYNLPPGGTVTQIADSDTSSLLVEGVDDADYLQIDTTNSAEKVIIAGGGAKVGINQSSPDAPLHIIGAGGDTGSTLSDPDANAAPTLVIENGSGDSKDRCTFLMNADGANGSIIDMYRADNRRMLLQATDTTSEFKANACALKVSTVGNHAIYFSPQGTECLRLTGGGNTGIATTAPGQILDVNSGSGNMIADGYDTHSLARYKENISVAGAGHLEKVTACPPKQWTSTPFVSAEEIKAATIEEFGQSAWDVQFPEEDSHRNKALYNMPAGEMKTWIDTWADARRAERRQDDKWQQLRLGLVADADDTAANFSEAIARNDEGEISGINTMSYIGILHAALVELAAKVEELENNGD